jgi:hypothetical protein
MREQSLTREDMIALTELRNSEGILKPKTRAWIDQHCEGKYHLTSIYKGGTTVPLKGVPGYKAELKRTPGQYKRAWEEKDHQAWEKNVCKLN